MTRAALKRSALALAVLWLVAFLLVAAIAPPDPFTQLLSAAPSLLLAVPIAWWYGFRYGSPT